MGRPAWRKTLPTKRSPAGEANMRENEEEASIGYAEPM